MIRSAGHTKFIDIHMRMYFLLNILYILYTYMHDCFFFLSVHLSMYLQQYQSICLFIYLYSSFFPSIYLIYMYI